MDKTEPPGPGFMWLSVEKTKKKGRGSRSLPHSLVCAPPHLSPTLVHVHPSHPPAHVHDASVSTCTSPPICLFMFIPNSHLFNPPPFAHPCPCSPLLPMLIHTNPHCSIMLVWPFFHAHLYMLILLEGEWFGGKR